MNASHTLPVAASLIVAARVRHSQAFRVLLLRRTQRGAFGGLTVFPGGAVEPQDGDLSLWSKAVQHPHCDLKLPISALRETFEETGLLLLDRSDSGRSRFLSDVDRRAWRSRVHSNAADFAQLVVNELGTAPAVRRLVYWSNWITPTDNPKRFDTHFFLTTIDSGDLISQDPHPTNTDAAKTHIDMNKINDTDQDRDDIFAQLSQICEPDATETASLVWLTPQEAIDAFHDRSSNITMLPPQYMILRELSSMIWHDLFHQVQNQVDPSIQNKPVTPTRLVTPILPERIGTSSRGNPVLAIPGDPMHSSIPKSRTRKRIELFSDRGRVVDMILDETVDHVETGLIHDGTDLKPSKL